MGGRASFKSFALRFFFILISNIILIENGPGNVVADADDIRKTPPPSPYVDVGDGVGDIAVGKFPPSSPLAPPPPLESGNSNGTGKTSAFKPSVIVIVGVLTTLFSITFLILLYAKHCKRGNVAITAGFGGNPNSRGPPARKNSGIDRTIVESLPIFRFGSLRGQKDGLECAVCLTRFESTEVLRLLPKCKHAFHVECVDTWLDAHSTCPLCRYRVDPEDILLVEDVKIPPQNPRIPPLPDNYDEVHIDVESGRNGSESEPRDRGESSPVLRRVSGRHSSVGEKGGGFLQVILERGNSDKSTQQNTRTTTTTSFRRSLDSATTLRRKSEAVTVGSIDRPRKDGMLLTQDKTGLERRLEHRIIVSPSPRSSGLHQRWSDVQGSDLLYLTSAMIISDSRRYPSSVPGSRQSLSRQQQNIHGGGEGAGRENRIDESSWDGRGVINSRSVSEITGLSRFSSNRSNRNRREGHHQGEQQRHAGVVSRWSAWISQSRAQPTPR